MKSNDLHPPDGADSDDDIHEALAAGDRGRAFRLMVERHWNAMYRRCRLLTGNSALADDALQTVFLKAFEHLDGFRPGAPFRPWLAKIASNEVNASLGRGPARYERSLPDDAVEPAAPERGPEAGLISRRSWKRLADCLRSFPDDGTRRAILFHYEDGLTFREVAAELGESESLWQQRVYRAVRAISEHLQNQGATRDDFVRYLQRPLEEPDASSKVAPTSEAKHEADVFAVLLAFAPAEHRQAIEWARDWYLEYADAYERVQDAFAVMRAMLAAPAEEAARRLSPRLIQLARERP